MNHPCRFSDDTKNYLSEFYCILDTMIKEMTEAELTESISHNFIVQMLPHHRAAIEMSHNLLQYSNWKPLCMIASQIIAEQTESIENMQAILCSCQKKCNPKQDVCLYQRRTAQILETMFCKMDHACSTNQINANFMREMIPHHMGAIEMSRNALNYDLCPGLYPVLDAIITSQERGVRQMERLLTLR